MTENFHDCARGEGVEEVIHPNVHLHILAKRTVGERSDNVSCCWVKDRVHLEISLGFRVSKCLPLNLIPTFTLSSFCSLTHSRWKKARIARRGTRAMPDARKQDPHQPIFWGKSETNIYTMDRTEIGDPCTNGSFSFQCFYLSKVVCNWP